MITKKVGYTCTLKEKEKKGAFKVPVISSSFCGLIMCGGGGGGRGGVGVDVCVCVCMCVFVCVCVCVCSF